MTWLDLVLPLALIAALSMLVACTTYHYVTDPQTNNTYYTEDLERVDAGAIEFTDARTGERVSLPSSEVREINEEEFMANTPHVE